LDLSALSDFYVCFWAMLMSGCGRQLTVDSTRSGYLIIITIFW